MDANFCKFALYIPWPWFSQFGHYQKGLHCFHYHITITTRCNQHQLQENSLLFWICKCILHLPLNPLDLVIKGLYFSYDNVFQPSEYYFLVAVVPVCWRCYDPHVGKFLSFLKSGLKLMMRQPYLLSTISMFNTEYHTLGNLCSFWSQIP